MTQVSLTQFQSQLCLSDQVVCYLLRENKLPVHTDAERGLVVDLNSDTLAVVVAAIRAREKSLPAPAQEILEEQIGTMVAEMFERITQNALRTVLAEVQQK